MAPIIAGVPKPCVTNEKCAKWCWVETSRTGAIRLVVPNGERSWAKKSVNSFINCLKKKISKFNLVLQ